MNVNPLIESALSGLMYNGKIVPVDFLTHEGRTDAHITYYTYSDQDMVFGDDEPELGETSGTLDIFCRGDFKPLLSACKSRLRAAGFSTETGPEQYEDDTGWNHVSLNFNIDDLEV